MAGRVWKLVAAGGLVGIAACGGSGGGVTSGTTVPARGDAGCDAACRFPTFERSAEPLTTTDGGNCDAALAAEYGGDCSNFHWLGLLGDPSVVFDGERYTMWYTAGERLVGDDGEPTWRAVIASSTSADGVVWEDTKDLERDVRAQLVGGTEGLDPEGVETFSAVPMDDGSYVAYFSGGLAASPSTDYAIGRATSADGVTWDKRTTPVMTSELAWEQPFDAGGFEVGGVLEPSVIVEDGVWRMWYAGFGRDPDEPDDVAYARIGYAESADGITWTKRPDPVFVRDPGVEFEALGVSHPNVVADPRGGYHLFYVGIGVDEDLRMGHAYSVDGFTWERNPANPIIEGVPGEFDAGMVGGPSALFVGDRLELFYMASTKPDFSEPVHFLRTVATGR